MEGSSASTQKESINHHHVNKTDKTQELNKPNEPIVRTIKKPIHNKNLTQKKVDTKWKQDIEQLRPKSEILQRIKQEVMRKYSSTYSPTSSSNCDEYLTYEFFQDDSDGGLKFRDTDDADKVAKTTRTRNEQPMSSEMRAQKNKESAKISHERKKAYDILIHKAVVDMENRIKDYMETEVQSKKLILDLRNQVETLKSKSNSYCHKQNGSINNSSDNSDTSSDDSSDQRIDSGNTLQDIINSEKQEQEYQGSKKKILSPIVSNISQDNDEHERPLKKKNDDQEVVFDDESPDSLFLATKVFEMPEMILPHDPQREESDDIIQNSLDPYSSLLTKPIEHQRRFC